MRFREYVMHELGPTTSEEAARSWLGISVSGDGEKLSTGLADSILGAPMAAALDAPEVDGLFPLVVWAQRHETTSAQSVLSEYLASHGYRVVVARFNGARLAYPWELRTDDERRQTFAAHLSHLDVAVRSIQASAGATPVAVLTWSYAAEMAAALQSTHDNVTMVIGLSSNPLAEAGVYHAEGVLSRIPVEELSANYVVMTEAVGADGTARTAPAVLAQLPAWSAFVRFNGLSHGNFNVLEGMIPGVYGIQEVQPWSRGGPVARSGYEAIARYVLGFLDFGVGLGPAQPEREWPWESEVSGGLVETTLYGR